MLQSNLSSRILEERARARSIRAVAAIFGGAILIAAGIMLSLGNAHIFKRESRRLPSTLALASTPAASDSAAPSRAGKSFTQDKQIPAESDELGQTLEEFQAEYESLSGKAGGQEGFFQKAVGKKVLWTVRVDHVLRMKAAVIIVFSSTERPDWAAYPISDARFPIRLEKQLMTLSRGDIIRIEGKIVYRGIKTLECSSFDVVSSGSQEHAR